MPNMYNFDKLINFFINFGFGKNCDFDFDKNIISGKKWIFLKRFWF